MKVGEAFPGKYLKASEIKGKRIQVVIDQVVLEDVGSGDHKLVVYFKGKERGVVLNKTNANALWGLTGSEDSDGWKGFACTLFTVPTTKPDGSPTDGIRIDPPDQNGRATPPPAPPPPQFTATDDDVPFMVLLAPFAGLVLSGLGLLV